MHCKICSSIEKKKNLKYIYSFLKKKYYQCLNCGFVFQNPLPSERFLKNIYSKEYFKENYKKKNSKFDQRQIQYKFDKKYLSNYFNDSKKRKILDFGCGNGNFLKLFKAQKFGYEFNPSAKVHNSVKRVLLKDVYKKKYDLVIMRGVIEHLLNFDNIVRRLCKCIKKGGLFYITATPNIYNLTFFLSKKNFNQNHPGHIFHFNNVNLSLLFLQRKFLNIDTIYQYAQTPYANFQNDFKKLKKQLKDYNKNKNTISPAAVGNMITMVFKKAE
jgi:SAM-dependent methyltransferase